MLVILVILSILVILCNPGYPTIVVKSPWDTRHKSLTELPVASYCYQIIVLSTNSLTPSPLSPPNQCWAKQVRSFFTNCNIEQGKGGWTTFLQGTWHLIIKLESFPTLLSRIVVILSNLVILCNPDFPSNR